MDLKCAQILNKMPFPIIIWKNVDGVYICYYTNNNIVSVNTTLDKYLNNRTDKIKKLYDNTIKYKKRQKVITDNKIVNVEFINDDTIFEYEHICDSDNHHMLLTISYKIRLPLTNIIGILSFLDIDSMSDEYRKYINIIKKSSYEIISVANDIIDYLNLEKGSVKLKNDKIKMIDLLKTCYDVVCDDAQSKQLKLKINLDENVPQLIVSDNERLKQIVINILNNAIEHTDVGGNIVLDVSLYKNNKEYPFRFDNSYAPKYNILFKIKDTGSGIDDDTKCRLKKICGITDDNSYYGFNGFNGFNGFGLNISNNICKIMNGNMWFKSEKDIGTIFYFNIICDGIHMV